VNARPEVRPATASPPDVFRDLLRLGLSLIVAALTLWLAFRGAAIGGLRSALGRADVFWILLALGSVLVSVAVAVVRWRVLFHPQSASLSWTNLAGAFLVGQMLNIMLPLRLGEMARAYWLSRSEGIPIGRALGTIGVEKLADLASLGLTAVALLVLAAVPPWAQSPGRVLVITGATASAGILFLAASRRWLLQCATRAAQRWPRAVGRRVVDLVETTLEGSRALDSWNMSAAVGVLSILVPLLAASTNYLLFIAFHLTLPLLAALLLLVSLQVANTIVSVPGNLGVFHYVTVLTLGAYSVDHDAALAYAIVLYLVALVPKILAGGVLLVCAPRELTAGMFAWRKAGSDV
jgi:glycosyltransferase 2 family protein